MTKDEAIYWIGKICAYLTSGNPIWRNEPIIEACNMAIDALKAQPEQQWIPCSERLSAYYEDVLISIGRYCNVGYVVPVNEEERYNWYFSGWYHSPNDVDAWMPLPQPYKEAGHE